jgi:hypothetical protein
MTISTLSRRQIGVRVGVALVTLATLAYAWRHRPAVTEAGDSVATMCRSEYASARSAADSARVDQLVPAWLGNRGWRRVPTCADLRKARRV